MILEYVRPPTQSHLTLKAKMGKIVRTFTIADATTLMELHGVLQELFEWWDYHLHSFTAMVGDGLLGKKRRCDSYSGEGWSDVDPAAGSDGESDDGMPNFSPLPQMRRETQPVTVFFREKGDKCKYMYDFGDSWEMSVTLMKVTPSTTFLPVPTGVSGKMRPPLEDSRCSEDDFEMYPEEYTLPTELLDNAWLFPSGYKNDVESPFARALLPRLASDEKPAETPTVEAESTAKKSPLKETTPKAGKKPAAKKVAAPTKAATVADAVVAVSGKKATPKKATPKKATPKKAPQ